MSVLIARLKKHAALIRTLRRASRFYEVPFPAALLRSANLYIFKKFSLKEIVVDGIFVPSIAAKHPVLISKERSLEFHRRSNPPHHWHLTEDKAVFYQICRDRGLPIPATIGWTGNGNNFDADGRMIEGNGAWEKYLDERLPKEFIVKDRGGAYGSGFLTFKRMGKSFYNARHEINCDLRGVTSMGLDFGGSKDVVIQERLFDALPLANLSGRRGLQTLRVTTMLEEDKSVSVLYYYLKILAGKEESDNFSSGESGNLEAYGDRNQGILRGAMGLHECGSGMVTYSAQPNTGVPFDGFEIPYWEEAIELARCGQRKFPELRSLSWDIALTGDGPKIIEANARWDPPGVCEPYIMSGDNWRRVFTNR